MSLRLGHPDFLQPETITRARPPSVTHTDARSRSARAPDATLDPHAPAPRSIDSISPKWQ
ncbi:hypothetical protein AB0C50_17455 [Micromonospora taraxaci]|uniref:hypothetical protein n=1 Tax=Micromonospora taraxaci TaxID=1316803 RepID=UPI0033CE1225